MPDHLHVVIAGKAPEAEPLSSMKRFKQRSNFWFANNRSEVRWQKDFYDHMLRREEDLRKHVRYILNNPIRAGLVDDWRLYPYKGSTVYDLDSWIIDP
jgi:REP element-mobilizing transposase RayT